VEESCSGAKLSTFCLQQRKKLGIKRMVAQSTSRIDISGKSAERVSVGLEQGGVLHYGKGSTRLEVTRIFYSFIGAELRPRLEFIAPRSHRWAILMRPYCALVIIVCFASDLKVSIHCGLARARCRYCQCLPRVLVTPPKQSIHCHTLQTGNWFPSLAWSRELSSVINEAEVVHVASSK
jgi:hypothetical protein